MYIFKFILTLTVEILLAPVSVQKDSSYFGNHWHVTITILDTFQMNPFYILWHLSCIKFLF